jgi:hypothetical protein
MGVLPATAGWEASMRRYEASWIIPRPLMLKMAGAKGARFTVCGALVWPSAVTVSAAWDYPASSQGIWMLTWPAET